MKTTEIIRQVATFRGPIQVAVNGRDDVRYVKVAKSAALVMLRENVPDNEYDCYCLGDTMFLDACNESETAQ
jgi:hypothetical protein